MNCSQIREQLAAYCAGWLDCTVRQAVSAHIEACPDCHAEAAEMEALWKAMETVGELEPSPHMRSRFLETLRAYQEGYQDAQRNQPVAAHPRFWVRWQAPWRVPQTALAAMLFAIGVLVGRHFVEPRQLSQDQDLARLQSQVESFRRLAALSLLQQASASARLQGVAYSDQIAEPDPRVQQALLHAVNHDPNVNVRLSAVDALARFARDPAVRRALADSIRAQDSPFVQVALIGVLVRSNGKDAIGALRELAQDWRVDRDVRQLAGSAAEKLGGNR
jgi:anti-sigma factor RsiW